MAMEQKSTRNVGMPKVSSTLSFESIIMIAKNQECNIVCTKRESGSSQCVRVGDMVTARG